MVEKFCVEMDVSRDVDQCPFPTVDKCTSGAHRNTETVVADLDGTLLRAHSPFPYYFLMAFEASSGASGYFRCLVLLLLFPLTYLLSESLATHLMIFITLCGLKLKDIEGVSRAVLLKFYSEDVHPESFRVFSSFGRKVVLTGNPRVMVEPFLKEMLGVDEVIGSEIEVDEKGRATGFLTKPGVLVGENKEEALKRWSIGGGEPHVGLGDQPSDYAFMAMCKEAYVVPTTAVSPVPSACLATPVIFHDGRLVQRPTPLTALAVLVWLPFGLLLACVRVTAGVWVPIRYLPLFYTLTGVRIVTTGTPPPKPASSGPTGSQSGILYVCNHRSLLDPVFVSIALARPVPAVTYSISSISEVLSPMPTVALSRDRAKDSSDMRAVLRRGELTLCPEGTTCREPFLLRFSALFAELSDRIVPVAVRTEMRMFHGTTARGNKAMDPFFCYMNPWVVYEVRFLSEVPRELTCGGGGRGSVEVANYVQRVLGACLGYKCTTLTRRDKYRVLAGNDGVVPVKESRSRKL